MFSELEVFADENNPSHVDENSNEENDVDDETMSGTLHILSLTSPHVFEFLDILTLI